MNPHAIEIQNAYNAAKAAQDVFEKELVAEYGPHGAIKARYAPDSHYHRQSLRDASFAFKEACDKLNAAWRHSRGEE